MALLTSCSRQATPPEPKGVAQVGEAVITAAQLEQKLAERQRRNPSVPLTAADRDAALDELVQFEALFAQAQRAGWHTNAELLAAFKRTVVGRFKEAQLAPRPAAAPTDAEVLAYYEQNAAQFTRPAQTRAAVLILETPAKATPEKRAEALARATELRTHALAEAADKPSFGSLAQRHSVDQATRYAGGDFGPLTTAEIEARYGAELARALAGLPTPGDVTAVFETPRGLGFAKLIEQRPPVRRPLADVREGITYQLTRARQAQAEREFETTARQAVAVRVNRAAVEAVPLPTRTDDPPALPGGETVHHRP